MRFNARKVKKLVITLNGGVDPKRPNDNPEPRCTLVGLRFRIRIGRVYAKG